MGISCRRFLFDRENRLFRLANTAFEEMLEDPARHPLPAFAGQRVRAAEALVELQGRQPTHVLQIAFVILGFDAQGCLDAQTFFEQQRALAELAIAPVVSDPERKGKVVTAAGRFIARGSRWRPSKALEQTVIEAAMGRIGCPRA